MANFKYLSTMGMPLIFCFIQVRRRQKLLVIDYLILHLYDLNTFVQIRFIKETWGKVDQIDFVENKKKKKLSL